MKPFEDQIPEEQVQQEQLIALLRQAYRQGQASFEVGEQQEEAIARVKERLEQLEESAGEPAGQFARESDSSLTFSERRGTARKKTFPQIMSALAAVLVVGVLIGSSALLFARRGSSTEASNVTPSRSDVTWNGLEMSMNITPGSYFLGELLAVDLTLTNHAHPTLTLGGTRYTASNLICGYAFLLPEQSGGTAPHYIPFTTPIEFAISCPAMRAPGPDGGPTLTPGKSVSGHFYVLLTSSGDVTLTGTAFFYVPTASSQGGTGWQRSPGPLTGHLPTLRVHVAPRAPADRTLTITRADANAVTIKAPAGLQLLAQTYVICQSADGHGWPAGNAVNRGDWPPLSTRVLQRPACNGTGLTYAQWKYAVGAIGYQVVQGQQGRFSGAAD